MFQHCRSSIFVEAPSSLRACLKTRYILSNHSPLWNKEGWQEKPDGVFRRKRHSRCSQRTTLPRQHRCALLPPLRRAKGNDETGTRFFKQSLTNIYACYYLVLCQRAAFVQVIIACCICLFCLVLFTPLLYAIPAPASIDSLQTLLTRLPLNSTRADALIEIWATMLEKGSTADDTAPYVQELSAVSQQCGYKRGIAYSMCSMALLYERRDNVLFGRYAFDALKRFGEISDVRGLAFAERTIAAFHFYSADYALSHRFYEQALRHFEQAQDLPQTAWTLYSLAILYGYEGNYIVSLSHQFKALRIFEQTNNTNGIASANQDLAMALLRMGSTAKAKEYFSKALSVYSANGKGTTEAAAETLPGISYCYQADRNTTQATATLLQALQYTQKRTTLRSRLVVSTVYDGLGEIAGMQDSVRLAEQYFLRAFQVLDSAGIFGNDANYSLYRLGIQSFTSQQYKAAKGYFHSTLERSLKSGDKRNAIRALLWLGKTALQERSLSDAAHFGREAFASAESIGQLEFSTSAAEVLSEVFERMGDTKTSLQYAKLTRRFRDSIATLERSQQLAGMEALYNLDRERSLSDLLRRDNEMQLLAAQRQQWLLLGSAVALVIVVGLTIALSRLNARRKGALEQIARQTERIRAISRIGAEIASTLVLENAIVMIYGYVNQLMDAPIFNIGDYLPEEHAIQMRYLIENGEFVAPPRVSMAETQRPAVRCVLERVPIVLNDVDIPVLVGVKPESLVYIPLISGERVTGVFSVQSLQKNSYPSENVDLLVAISAYIATALENASAFARIKEQQAELEKQASIIQLANVTLSERNVVLEKLTTKVRENIAYAETIQRAVLPPESEREEVLGKHFVLYKPMEIISGDFYWMQRVEFSTLVAVVDCTGHGIPGAFMSMIGNDLLNQIVLEKGITNPAWILTELHYAVRHALKQTNDLESNHDGMDVCLCRIDKEGITFAGARRSLYIVREGALMELEGDSKPIGGFQREAKRVFSSKRLDLEPSSTTMLYLTSDGFADQHNSRREKFGIKRLNNLFQQFAPMKMHHQREILETALHEHQGTVQQRDDITIMGIQLF